MTCVERATQHEQRLKNQLATASRTRLQLQAHERATARKARAKRHQRIGALADEAGLCVWDDATLARLFALLTPLTDMPHPEAVLESLMHEDAPFGGDGDARGLSYKPS